MKRREFNRMVGALAVAPVVGRPVRQIESRRRWSLTADIAECCSCDIPCPCNFGRPFDPCHGTRLIEITQGDFEGADLTGIRFVVTFFRTQWTRIYLDDSMTQAQMAAADALLPIAFRGFVQGARSTQRVPLTVERTTDMVRFSVAESAIEMRLLPGLNGELIRVTGLPNDAYHDYVQYESVVHRHDSVDGSWSHAGTNGFTSEMRATG